MGGHGINVRIILRVARYVWIDNEALTGLL